MVLCMAAVGMSLYATVLNVKSTLRGVRGIWGV